tara:strand:+ start:1511 stop:2509 length:999 start_codon:yes stop_codon:yes gene_type:complete
MNKILLIIILLVLLLLYNNPEYFSYISQHIIISKYYSKPYTYLFSTLDHSEIINSINKFIPLKKINMYSDFDRYNNIKNGKYDFAIINRNDIKENDNIKIIFGINNTFIYLIVKSNSNINSFQDCNNKNIVINKNNIIIPKIFNLLNINVNIIEKDLIDIKVHEDFYNNNKYDGIFNQNNYNDFNNFYIDKNIRIITGNTNINGINEQENILKLLNYDVNVNSIHIEKRKLKNKFYSPFNIEIYDSFLCDKEILVCRNNISDQYVYSLINIILKEGIGLSIYDEQNEFDVNNDIIDKKIHNGALKYLKKFGYVSYNNNPKCKYYMGITHCPL